MSEASERRGRLLAEYATVSPVLLPASEGRFHRLLLLSVLTALGLGAALSAVEPPALPAPAVAATPTPFRWQPAARPPATAAPAVEAPPRSVAPRPTVQRAEERPRAAPARAQAEEGTSAPPAGVPARRVYGVREVYAHGLGAGGGALLTKRGNTLAGPADTLLATAADLAAGGNAAAGQPPTTKPVLLQQVKPRYSPAMLAARVSGVVKLHLLVGVSGAVEDVDVLADIGYDSGELASAACRQFRFEPACEADRPVPAWIRLSIRFEFQE